MLPIHKQADHIGDVVKEYEAAPSHISHENILVVNEGGDASLQVCRALEVQYQTVRPTNSEQKGRGREHEGASHRE